MEAVAEKGALHASFLLSTVIFCHVDENEILEPDWKSQNKQDGNEDHKNEVQEDQGKKCKMK